MKFSLFASLVFTVITSCYGDNIPFSTGDGETFDDTIEISGLSSSVAAYFDNAGVLHVRCQTDADCFAAQGYFHAAHRFFQMDLRRRLARGRLSEVIGVVALDIDIHNRLIFANRDGQPMEEVLLANADSDSVAALEAYTRGVNAWLADLRAGQHGAKTAAERQYDMIDSSILADWEVLDSVASSLLLIDDLTNDTASDIEFGAIYADDALGTDAAGDIFTRRPASPSTIVPAANASERPTTQVLTPSHLEQLHRAKNLFKNVLSRIPDSRRYPDRGGSNNWVLGRALGDGSTLLANDPHLALSNPSVWYLVHLDSKTEGQGDLHIAGVSFAGLPGILIGHNEDIAWGLTTTLGDFTDVYMETLTDDNQGVVADGDDVAFIKREETFVVSQAPDAVRTLLYVPHHGPVLGELDTVEKMALTMRWTLQDAETDLNYLNGLYKASSVQEARDALRNVTTVGQNFVIIDRRGNYGWFPYNRWRERPFITTFPSNLPLPGTGAAEWGDVIPYEDIPQLLNPAQGYIATANNDFTGALADGDPSNDGQSVIQWNVAPGYRHERIVQRIEAETSHDLESMQSIQSDVYSLLGKSVVPAIVAEANTISTLSAEAQLVVTALSSWDFECPTGLDGSDAQASPPITDSRVLTSAVGCTAFHVLWPRLRKEIFGDELMAANVSRSPGHNSTVFALTEADPFSGRTYFDDVSTPSVVESKADCIAAALESAAAYLVGQLGNDSNDWLWGRLHTVTLRASLFSDLGLIQFDSPTFANDGGFNTVDVASPWRSARDDYSHTRGASTRMACQANASAPVQCTIELPGGQRHHRDDDFYLSLLPLWLKNQPIPLIFSVAEAQSSAVQAIELIAE